MIDDLVSRIVAIVGNLIWVKYLSLEVEEHLKLVSLYRYRECHVLAIQVSCWLNTSKAAPTSLACRSPFVVYFLYDACNGEYSTCE